MAQAHQLHSVISGPALLASVIYKPDGFSLSAFLETPTETNVRLSSSAAGDSGKTYKLVGYNDSGTLVSEVVTLNGSDGRTPVNSSNTYASITEFSGDLANNNSGNIHVYDSGASVTNGVPNRAIGTISSGNSMNLAYINWLSLPPNTVLRIKKIHFTLSGNVSTHRINLRQTDGGGNINSSASKKTRTWGLIAGVNSFDYDDGLIIRNMSTNKNYLWWEVDFLAGDANAKVTIDAMISIE
jgi:hypothetical protein